MGLADSDLSDLFVLELLQLPLPRACMKVLELIYGGHPGSQAPSRQDVSRESIRKKVCGFEETSSATSWPPGDISIISHGVG